MAAVTPCPLLQVAIIAGNFELAEYIKSHKETDIGRWAWARARARAGAARPGLAEQAPSPLSSP